MSKRKGSPSTKEVIVTGSEDLIDQAYFPFIRPLGNLVVLCAQAEAALLAFSGLRALRAVPNHFCRRKQNAAK